MVTLQVVQPEEERKELISKRIVSLIHDPIVLVFPNMIRNLLKTDRSLSDVVQGQNNQIKSITSYG
ncbi:hypothetical protein YTPLAS72_16440 [Nitrospira sp.]|nr:hypothetical protein YTPLAS72_16440 [Nitrospira sp.]